MPPDQIAMLTGAVAIVAFLYASVGHAGASGYIAVMTLAGLAATVIRPTALALNIVVASVATWHFVRAGHFSWRLFWPFALLAVPGAYLGGQIHVPTEVFKVVVGVVLLLSAVRLLLPSPPEVPVVPPRVTVALPVGAALGFLAGLTGTGGGIFLTPLLLLMGWAGAKQAAAVSALFILLNSAAGLAGNYASTAHIPSLAVPLAAAALVGGAIGSFCGSRRFPHQVIRRLLGIVLLIAGAKLVMSS